MPIHHRYVVEIFDEVRDGMSSGIQKCRDFLNKIEDDSDWAFLIKVHSLIDNSVTDVLVTFLGEPKARRLLERLPLADQEIGKLSLAKDFSILDAPQRRFIRNLSTLRNNLAHRSDHVDFTFNEYLSGLDKRQLIAWQEAILCFPIDSQESRAYWQRMALNQPRTTVWFSTYLLIALLNVAAMEKQAGRKTNEAALKTAEEIYQSLVPEAHEG